MGASPAAAYSICCYANSGMTTVDVVTPRRERNVVLLPALSLRFRRSSNCDLSPAGTAGLFRPGLPAATRQWRGRTQPQSR